MRPYSVNQIQNLLEVAWQKPVSESADHSFVTQPADSMQIRQMERVCGLAMLEPLMKLRCANRTHAGRRGWTQTNTPKCIENSPEFLSLFLAMQTNCIQAGAKSLARNYATK